VRVLYWLFWVTDGFGDGWEPMNKSEIHGFLRSLGRAGGRTISGCFWSVWQYVSCLRYDDDSFPREKSSAVQSVCEEDVSL
jgi:hypothetical protein